MHRFGDEVSVVVCDFAVPYFNVDILLLLRVCLSLIDRGPIRPATSPQTSDHGQIFPPAC